MNVQAPDTYLADLVTIPNVPNPVPNTPEIQENLIYIAVGFVIICVLVSLALLRKIKKL